MGVVKWRLCSATLLGIGYFLIDIVLGQYSSRREATKARPGKAVAKPLGHMFRGSIRTAGGPWDELVDDDKALVLDIFVRVKPQPQSTLPGRDDRRKVRATI